MWKCILSLLLFPLIASADEMSTLKSVHEISPQTSQLIWVMSTALPTSTAQLWTYSAEGWSKRGDQFPVVVGRNGTIDASGKVEGDGKTPEGLYPLIELFGRGPRSGLHLPYNVIESNDKWIDDQTSADYNRWVRGDSSAKSYENLQRADGQYDLFAVIGYNMNPAIPGKGSAIFMHIWPAPDKGTSGCVAMASEKLGEVIDWLDAKSSPSILIGNLK